jgi:hypothetical protein
MNKLKMKEKREIFFRNKPVVINGLGKGGGTGLTGYLCAVVTKSVDT